MSDKKFASSVMTQSRCKISTKCVYQFKTKVHIFIQQPFVVVLASKTLLCGTPQRTSFLLSSLPPQRGIMPAPLHRCEDCGSWVRGEHRFTHRCLLNQVDRLRSVERPERGIAQRGNLARNTLGREAFQLSPHTLHVSFDSGLTDLAALSQLHLFH